MADCTTKPGGGAAWVTGSVSTQAGEVKRISTRWNHEDFRGQIKCRLINSFRMNYSIEPGIYAVGNAGPESPVLVSANYKLSFDLLRRELNGLSAWVLVLDTKGINVWCAAGKGSFSTRELVRRIEATQLTDVVRHRDIILPQLAAPGIQAHLVKKETKFSVSYGPIRAKDIPAYLKAGKTATQEMRTISFSLVDRLVLTPMELVPAGRKMLYYFLAVFIIFGLQPEGILFRDAFSTGLPFASMGILAVLAGAFFTPLLLPLIPFRSFAVKGWLAGLIFSVLFIGLKYDFLINNIILLVLTLLLFPALSSYLALNFTGSTPFTGISGVKKELKITLPLYITALAVSLGLTILYLLKKWGIL
ncbi:MAG: acetyl-CoA synthase subunit gamma [Planctomycetes bacterium]|nr:acetyl-CoA synthase subunit gamma [Planctomycetota bacterium]